MDQQPAGADVLCTLLAAAWQPASDGCGAAACGKLAVDNLCTLLSAALQPALTDRGDCMRGCCWQGAFWTALQLVLGRRQRGGSLTRTTTAFCGAPPGSRPEPVDGLGLAGSSLAQTTSALFRQDFENLYVTWHLALLALLATALGLVPGGREFENVHSLRMKRAFSLSAVWRYEFWV